MGWTFGSRLINLENKLGENEWKKVGSGLRFSNCDKAKEERKEMFSA
jgi:hypothetical protein